MDLVLNTFEADMDDLVQAGVDAESAGINGLWVPDHFSGSVVNRRWSRDAFTCLGALAQATEKVRLGTLVANIRNRHAAQLTSGINTVSALAPGRVVLGIGSGAAPGSRFAVEHDAIGTILGDDEYRRALLVEHITTVRALHATDHTTDDSSNSMDIQLAVTDGSPCPPIVVGASARPTTEVAIVYADGVNLRVTPQTGELVALARSIAGPDFEISVLTGLEEHELVVSTYRRMGVDRLIIGVDLCANSRPTRELFEVLVNSVRTP